MESLLPVFETILSCMDVACVVYPQILDLGLFLPLFIFKKSCFRQLHITISTSWKVILKSARKSKVCELSAYLKWNMHGIPLNLRQKCFNALEKLLGCDPSQPVASLLHDVNVLRAGDGSTLTA